MTDDKGAVDKMRLVLEKIRSCLPKDPNQSMFPWTANKLGKIIDDALECPLDGSIDKGAGEGAVDLRMTAYYYTFYPTGRYAVDRILSAVACAGKAFHNTDCWTEECAPYDGHVGETPIDWIQNAANDCSADFKSAYEAGRKAERERCAKIAESFTECLAGPKIAEKIRGGQDAK